MTVLVSQHGAGCQCVECRRAQRTVAGFDGAAGKMMRALTALICEPWLIVPEMHSTLTQIVRAHAIGGAEESAQHAKALGYGTNPKKREFAVAGSAAVIPCEGVIGRKFDSVLYSSGVTSIDIFQRMVQAASDDDEIDSILLAFDSPGGVVTGVPEAAEAVRQAAQRKVVLAYADGRMQSAAYYVASQADLIYAMPSGDVGSIGVYMALLDQSRAAEMAGLKVQMFRSGRFKGMGTPGTSLREEESAMLQKRVDELGAQFRATVRAGVARRSAMTGRALTISDDLMQGQSFTAAAARAAGLIDELTTFDVALADARELGKHRPVTKKG